MDVARAAERVWFDDDGIARAVRAVLAPARLAYAGAVRARGALYDAGIAAAHPLALPALSVGNVTVGGTGKTPIAAWFAGRLQATGARPAIVMRGYGDDEPLVHAVLTPGIEVVTDADRVRGAAEAARRGADVVVLDDAFQHRRARRDVDIVLVAAERMTESARLLPAGPYREPLSALRRASAVVVTRKAASIDAARRATQRVAHAAPGVPIAHVALHLDRLRAWRADAATVAPAPHVESTSLDAIAGETLLAVAAIGDPHAFFAQLQQRGARVHAAPFADHHAFSEADARALADRASHVDRVVCTLKDAVKLGPVWPRLAPALWYVSQRVVVEDGADVLDELVARLLAARDRQHLHSGSGRPS
ncbi:MAG: tetraacyldisaccharide 4'-kinase [Gemmatirosa sp.]|nr:tetraacyldisaccharide 4'-kinase [Gemmatirosa sp.]